MFDATGINDEFEVPLEPRKFDTMNDYLLWAVDRFHGTPIYAEDGELIDVRGTVVLLGTPRFTWNGKERTVVEPVLQTISGQFGFIVIAGEAHFLPIDEGIPDPETIEPALFYYKSIWRKSCGGPLDPSNYCVAVNGFKAHGGPFAFGYNSIGGSANLQGNVAMSQTTSLTANVTFMDSSMRPLRVAASSPEITLGRFARTAVYAWSVGVVEWSLVSPSALYWNTAFLRVTGGSTGNTFVFPASFPPSSANATMTIVP